MNTKTFLCNKKAISSMKSGENPDIHILICKRFYFSGFFPDAIHQVFRKLYNFINYIYSKLIYLQHEYDNSV